eukprot:19636-Heterococcus_DN1.PRE.2
MLLNVEHPPALWLSHLAQYACPPPMNQCNTNTAATLQQTTALLQLWLESCRCYQPAFVSSNSSRISSVSHLKHAIDSVSTVLTCASLCSNRQSSRFEAAATLQLQLHTCCCVIKSMQQVQWHKRVQCYTHRVCCVYSA